MRKILTVVLVGECEIPHEEMRVFPFKLDGTGLHILKKYLGTPSTTNSRTSSTSSTATLDGALPTLASLLNSEENTDALTGIAIGSKIRRLLVLTIVLALLTRKYKRWAATAHSEDGDVRAQAFGDTINGDAMTRPLSRWWSSITEPRYSSPEQQHGLCAQMSSTPHWFPYQSVIVELPCDNPSDVCQSSPAVSKLPNRATSLARPQNVWTVY